MRVLSVALGEAVYKASYETSFQHTVPADNVCRTNGWLSYYYPNFRPHLFQSNTGILGILITWRFRKRLWSWLGTTYLGTSCQDLWHLFSWWVLLDDNVGAYLQHYPHAGERGIGALPLGGTLKFLCLCEPFLRLSCIFFAPLTWHLAAYLICKLVTLINTEM